MHIILIKTIFVILGYILGKITCNAHFKRAGIWITLVVFALINGLHSFIDGVSLAGFESGQGILFMLGHEVLRQPLLYAVFFAMVAPFTLSRTFRYGGAFIAVTAVWIVTAVLGAKTGSHIVGLASFEPIVHYLQYLFVGDIIHHMVDYFYHRPKPVKG